MSQIRPVESGFQSLFSAVIPLVVCLFLPLPAASFGSTRIRIDSVPLEYRPTAGSGLPEAVSIESYSFEVNKETGRARVMVEYTYPNRQVFGLEGGPGPQPTLAQLPGLIYDAGANAVVYIGEDRKTVCATVQLQTVLRRKKTIVKSTGACVVTWRTVDHAEDDGWGIRRFRAIDVFFEVP